MQFRAKRTPSRDYLASLKKDTSKRSDLYDFTGYILQPSTEFADLKEYYLIEHQYAYQFLLNYEDADAGRVVNQRVGCLPDFREQEIIISASKGVGNVLCGYGFHLSPHVHVHVRFSSRIMPQVKPFEKQVYELVSSFVISGEN